MIDHLSLPVSDYESGRAFYDACLGALGYKKLMDLDLGAEGMAAGYGKDRPAFWIGTPPEASPASIATQGQHIALAAPDRAAVAAFHAQGLAAGGRDDGAPGLRLHYHGHYYAAFLVDPDGHRIEAVCHRPE